MRSAKRPEQQVHLSRAAMPAAVAQAAEPVRTRILGHCPRPSPRDSGLGYIGKIRPPGHDPRNPSSLAPRHPVPPVRAGHLAARHRAAARQADRQARRRAGDRSLLASADRHHRPPLLAEARRGARGRDRHPHRHRRATLEAAANRASPTRCAAATRPAPSSSSSSTPSATTSRKALPIGEQRVVSGRVEPIGNELQMTHPDHIVAARRDRRAEARRAGLSADRGPHAADPAAAPCGRRSSARRSCRNGSIRPFASARAGPPGATASGPLHAPQSAERSGARPAGAPAPRL